MKKNKIVVLAGMALLMVGTILNVHDALNEFGVMEISLHPQVMAQTGTTSGTTTNMGKQLETDVKCTKQPPPRVLHLSQRVLEPILISMVVLVQVMES